MSFPYFPGIPPLSQNQVIAGGAVAASGLLQNVLNKRAPKWGIYKSDGTTMAITPDSFVGIEYLNSQHVSNYPIEKGSFASFNKVQNPFNAIVKISKGGTESDRSAFLDTLETLMASTDLLILIAEDRLYRNVTLERFDYRRDSGGGAGMIVASVHLVEIREAAISGPTSPGAANATAAPASAQSSVGNGQVQTQAPVKPTGRVQ